MVDSDFSTLRSVLLSKTSDSENLDQKSSHWLSGTSGFHLNKLKVSGVGGFSPRTKRLPLSKLYHSILQILNFENLSVPFNSKYYLLSDTALRLQSRSLDNDALRNVFTLNLLDKIFGLYDRVICVIGDGQAHFCSPLLLANNKNKVISVNLPEVLLSDLELIQHLGLSRDSVSICRTKNDLTAFLASDSSKLAMICASDSNILKCQPIDIFVNIASFQEMTIKVIENYFEIIKSSINGAYLYCCNRKEKILIGGEVLAFYAYPWSNYSEILIDEPCPWHLLFYTAFVKKYIPLPHIRRKFDGIVLHRLVKYPANYS